MTLKELIRQKFFPCPVCLDRKQKKWDYNHTEHGRMVRKRYTQTPKAKETRKRVKARYRSNPINRLKELAYARKHGRVYYYAHREECIRKSVERRRRRNLLKKALLQQKEGNQAVNKENCPIPLTISILNND